MMSGAKSRNKILIDSSPGWKITKPFQEKNRTSLAEHEIQLNAALRTVVTIDSDLVNRVLGDGKL